MSSDIGVKTWAGWLLVVAVLCACVAPRPAREGRISEAVYLEKAELTSAPEDVDDQWMMQTTVVRTSSPNVLGEYAFPGFVGPLNLVNFRFSEDALQVLNGQELQRDDPDNPNDDHSTLTSRVLLEFPGEHVDVKFLETLNGERTNRIEENTERRWTERDEFRVDFEQASLDPIATTTWFYGEYVADCAAPVGANLVPGSYEFDTDEQHLSFELEVNYNVTVTGNCYDLVSLATGTGTVTVHYRLSFLRRNKTAMAAYEPEVIEEKAEVNKRYGAFQRLAIYQDGESGLLDAKSYLQRWNPTRPSDDPVVFYFAKGFPERFKPMFEEIKDETNAVLKDAGADLRFDFREYDDAGVERRLGDIRYSFVVWHQDIATTRGLLGYGPSNSDPRTGELINASLNLYNVGMDYYRYLIQAYLEGHGAEPPGDSCEPGERLVPQDDEGKLSATERLGSGLFTEMRRVMELEESEAQADPRASFIPQPIRGDEDGDGRPDFLTDYVRSLGEYRYTRPEWNEYVYLNGQMPLGEFPERLAKERQFQKELHSISMNENPLGVGELSGRKGIEALHEFANRFRDYRSNHDELQADRDLLLARHNIYEFNDYDAISAIAAGARKCTDDGLWESDEAYSERLIEDVVMHVAIHEFGHNLSLRHNFYGSVDATHMREGELSASVMDYVQAYEEAGTTRGWGSYDAAALSWIYGDEAARERAMAEDHLFCTDQHRYRSPLCTAHDLGITPSQITLNAIERYDWLYEIRNRRAYRTFWDTANYADQVYSAIFSLQRMWYLAIFDWGGGGIQDTLKRLDQKDETREVLSDQEYDVVARDFLADVSASVDMTMAFLDAIINQDASTRNYQTEFDPFFGDVLRLGIIDDKLFATFAFMDLQQVNNYDPNVQTYAAMYDYTLDSRNLALSQRIMDDMLGANYDTFPWFRFLAVELFSTATNSNLIGDVGLRSRIAIRRYEEVEQLTAEFGPDVLTEVMRQGNPTQIFVHEGEQYIYSYLADQGWHLVASEARSPVSFQYMRDYNESLNGVRSGQQDNYGLKTLLAYYEIYNNFVGF